MDPPPPIPSRNSKTKLTHGTPPCLIPEIISLTSLLPPGLSKRIERPPKPPSPMTELEIALHHKRQSLKSNSKSNPVSPTNSGTMIKIGRHKKEKNSPQISPNLSCSNEVEILFGDEHVTYSFEKNAPPKKVTLPDLDRLRPLIPDSNENQLFKNSIPGLTGSEMRMLDEFNICSPPNDLLASCLNELSDMKGFLSSQKISETDSIGSNFSLQELSHLRAPSFPEVESTDSFTASVRCDSFSALDDLDALIADLDEMALGIESPEKSSHSDLASPESNSTPQSVDTFEVKNSFQTNHKPDPIHVPQHSISSQDDVFETHLSPNDSKEAKISLALSKLRLANQRRLVLKIYDINMSYKMVKIVENMSARSVCNTMAEKNHQTPGPNWCLVEFLTALGLERTIEDHEPLLDVIAHWPRQHTNVIIFKNISEKYLLLKKPQLFMPAIHPLATNNDSNFDDATRRRILIKELFYDKTLPPISNVLNIKIGKKGAWRKIFCVLRTSGLYYSKSRRSSTKDLVNLVTWKKVELYRGQRYVEMYKSPDKFCCSLVPAGRLDQVEKLIVHMCFPSKRMLEVWMACISLAKYSTQLVLNYQENFELYPWLENEGDLSNPMSEVTPRSQESALTTEEKQMLHNELQMNSLANPLIDSLDVLEEKKIKFSSTSDLDSRESIKKSSKIAASFSNAWAAGDSVFIPQAADGNHVEQSPIDKFQPFSYTQGNLLASKFTLV